MLEACRRLGLATVAYSPIAKGRVKDDRTLARIGHLHRKTAAQVCLRWLVQQNVAAIPRTSKLERLQENLGVFDFELSEEEMATISAMGSSAGRMVNVGGGLGLSIDPGGCPRGRSKVSTGMLAVFETPGTLSDYAGSSP